MTAQPKNFGILITEPYQKRLAPAKPIDLWEPGQGEIRIRVEAAAQNPVDWKQIDNNFGLVSFPFILGVDVAGVVDKVGEGVTKFKVGDRVVTMTYLAKHPKYGVYQQYCIGIADATIPIPPSYTFDQAATIPLAYWTAAVGLFSHVQLPLPLDTSNRITPRVTPGETLLVWGGSSSVGALAVQLGVILGFKVIATCSPRNFDYVRGLGAEEVLDYHDPDIVEKIRKLAPDLHYAYDAISEHGSTSSILSSFSPAPASNPSRVADLVIVLPFPGTPPPEIKTHHVFAGLIHHPGHEAEKESLTELWEILMREGRIKPNPVRVMPDGLGSVDEGFERMRRGEVSGEKLVYHPAETKLE